MNERIELADIIDMMIRRWWIWAVCAVAFSILAFIYTEIFVDPMYRSTGSVYVNAQRTQNVDITAGEMSSSQTLVVTYSEILKRRSFLSQISEDLENRYSPDELAGMISYAAVNKTEIMEVSVSGKVPQDVYDICHSVLLHAPDELIRVVNAGSVKILEDGQVPNVPYSPIVKRDTLIAFLAGMLVGAGIIFLLELFDTRIKTRDDIINKYPEPLLGEIPEVMPIEEVSIK